MDGCSLQETDSLDKEPIMNYPIIKNPFEHITYNSVVEKITKPIPPLTPIKPENEEKGSWIGKIIISLLMGGLIFFSIAVGDFIPDSNEDLLIALFVGVIVMGITIAFLNEAEENSEKEYQRKLKVYNEEISKYKPQYRKYSQQLQEYEIQEYAKNDPTMRIMLLASEVVNSVSDTIRPSANEDSYKKGVTESYFKTFLDEYFGDNIYDNLTINHPETDHDDEEIRYLYHPDFVFYSKEQGICIDIEIDEPYVGSTGEPIHFIGYDDYRDDFFIRNKWFVMRFTEKQIFLTPRECCKEIYKISRAYAPGSVKDIDVSGIDNVPQDILWTREEAVKLAKEKYRRSYLTQEYITLLNDNYKIPSKEEENDSPPIFPYSKPDYDGIDDLPF